MQGLELSKQYYEQHGKEMLDKFPHLLPYLAVGLVSSGSECLGYDDDISQDHDFDPGFCIFLPGEDLVSSRDAFQIERAYSKLPRDFLGHHAKPNSRRGVMRIDDFVRSRFNGLGTTSLRPWLYADEQLLLEIVSGELFLDNLGRMTQIRQDMAYLPEDVRLKKLVGELIVMHQSGVYNYARCVQRNELGAAQLAMCEFVKAAIHVIFLLHRKYMPYYKWQFRALREMSVPDDIIYSLEFLLSSDNVASYSSKVELVAHVTDYILNQIRSQKLSEHPSPYLDVQAQVINASIKDNEIRNMHLMCAV